MTLLLPLLMAVSLADPNTITIQDFASHWLSPGKPVGQVFSFEGWVIPPNTVISHAWTQMQSDGTIQVIRAESPTYLKVTGEKFRPVNYLDFVEFAKAYPGDPNWIPPVEPVIECPVWVTKSGSKYHTQYCRYSVGAVKISLAEAVAKKREPCGVCDPNTCAELPPEPNEPTLEEVLKDITDPNLIGAVRTVMESN